MAAFTKIQNWARRDNFMPFSIALERRETQIFSLLILTQIAVSSKDIYYVKHASGWS